MEVVLVRWPAERGRREELNGLGLPHLLLVEEGHHPPAPESVLEDWIRVPASEADMRVRIDALVARSTTEPSNAAPTLDDDGVLRANGGWVAVPPVEARLLRPLVERYGAVVSRETLRRAGWPDRSSGNANTSASPSERNVLDVHVLRIRRRLAPVGLAIRTVRSRGYLLEPCDATASILARTTAGSPR